MTRKRYSLPFKTATTTEVMLGAWHYRTTQADWRTLEEGVPGWDYLTRLEFCRGAAVDTPAVRGICELPEDSALDLIVTAHSPVARFRRVVYRSPLEGNQGESKISFEVPSADLASHLRLDTEIVLSGEPSTRGRFSAQRAGSRLFQDSVSIELEGNRSRMPMQIAHFANQLAWLHAPNAPWHIECGSGDLHMPVMHDLRVYLNSDQQQFIDAANRGDATVVSLLKADIAKRILETALAEDAFIDNLTDFEEGTMGEAARRLLKLCFEGSAVRDVQSLQRNNNAKFEAVIRSRFASQHD